MSAIPSDVAEFRARFRAANPPWVLSGWRHFGFILALAAAGTALAAAMAREPKWWEWAAVPAGFLVANFVEWWAHKNPMHHPFRGLGVMYERHTLEHHRFFTHEAMEAETPDDFGMVLFSPSSLVFFLGGCALPIALALFCLVSRNAGWLFVGLAIDYYASYECFHLAYHLPEGSLARRLPGMEFLRRHHLHHHDPALMSRWNFNVNFPIFDALLGTRWRA